MQVGLFFQVDNIHEMSYGFSKRQRKNFAKADTIIYSKDLNVPLF